MARAPTKLLSKFSLDGSFVFKGLDPTLLERLASVATLRSLRPGEYLFHADDPSNGFYGVLDGLLKVGVTAEDGHARLIAILGPGDIVGEMGVVDGHPRSADVIALRASELAFIRLSDFEAIAEANPRIYRHILRAVSVRLRRTNEAGSARSLLPLEGRLARALLGLSERFGNDLPDGRTLIRYKITQTDIGNMCGAARENVNRQFANWKRDDLLSKISGYYCLHNKEEFNRMADF